MGSVVRKVRTQLAPVILVAILGAPAIAAGSDDTTILREIESTAARDARLDGANVSVRVRDGEVILFGSVRLYLQKILFDQLAWRTKGVIEVDSEIRVDPILRPASSVIERQIRHIVKEHERFRGSSLQVRVIEGRAYLSGSFHNPSDVMFLKHRVAEIEGVVAIIIDPRFTV